MPALAREFAANVALAPWIECFWMQAVLSRPIRVLPDTCADLIFSQAGGLQVAGTMTSPLLVAPGQTAYAGIRFRAGMLAEFLKLPATELTDRVIPLEQILGRPGRALDERLRNAITAGEMKRILESHIVPVRGISRFRAAIRHLVEHAGQLPVAEISKLAGMSARQFRRRCLEEVGITPKRLARIARFRRVCGRISLCAKPDWALLAAETGYFDQAHLIHDFQEFSGLTPGDYMAHRAA